MDVADWPGAVAGLRSTGPVTTIVMPSSSFTFGDSCLWQGYSKDGTGYWIKGANNPQGPKVPINEFVVSRVGQLIGAAVCRVELVEPAPELLGTQLPFGQTIASGIASGSQDIGGAEERRVLDRRTDDTNRKRHVGMYAIYDWCWGVDAQYLYRVGGDWEVHSHDHGNFFSGPSWTEGDLLARVNMPHELGTARSGLDSAAKEEVADAIEAVTTMDIEAILRQVPASWGATDRELEALGWFLDSRTAAVATRIRHL